MSNSLLIFVKLLTQIASSQVMKVYAIVPTLFAKTYLVVASSAGDFLKLINSTYQCTNLDGGHA